MSLITHSRRSFLQVATAGLGGALLAARPTRASVRSVSRDRTIGYAIAGIGSLSRNQLLPALEKTRYARLAGVVTGSPEKGRQVIEQYGIAPENVYDYDTMERMGDNPDIDVVYVVTPNVLHLEHTLSAARAGKHVLCEKPMAGSSADCEVMIAACRDAGVKLAIGYRCQFEPHHLECIRLVREKDLGNLQVLEAGLGFTIGDPGQWRLRQDLAGGGAMMDVGIYPLQAARYLAGEEPVRVTAFETKTDPVKFAEVDESITFQMLFPSGMIASCVTSYNARGMNHFRGYCSRGTFSMAPAYSYVGLNGSSSKGAIQFEPTDHFAVEMDDFARCILEDRESSVPGEEGLRDLVIIEAIYESIRTGHAVDLI